MPRPLRSAQDGGFYRMLNRANLVRLGRWGVWATVDHWQAELFTGVDQRCKVFQGSSGTNVRAVTQHETAARGKSLKRDLCHLLDLFSGAVEHEHRIDVAPQMHAAAQILRGHLRIDDMSKSIETRYVQIVHQRLVKMLALAAHVHSPAGVEALAKDIIKPAYK